MKKFWLISGLILFFIILLAWQAFEQGQNSFRLRDVLLEVHAPEEISSGQEVVYLIKYANNTKTTLKQVELSFGDFRENLENLKSGQEGEVEIKKRIFGQEQELKISKAKLRYLPANFSSFFETAAFSEIKIISSLIIASLDGPSKAASGELVEFTLNYANKSENIFENLEINFAYPEKFSVQGQDNFIIQKLEKDQIGSLKIKGILTGQEGEIKTLIAKIGQITEIKAEVEITGFPLLIEQTYNQEKYFIKYQNKSDLLLKNAIIILELDSQAFDFNSLQVKQGSFDKFNKKITWTSAGVSELADLEPGEKGELDFKIKIKDPLPQDKNFILQGIAKITAGEISNSHKLSIKLDSKLVLQVKAYYNKGELPPKVGQSTYYNIHWQILNSSNDLEDAVITASLPQSISWHSAVNNEHGRIYYDEAANEIVWDLGKVPAWTGHYSPVYETVFQVKLEPISQQANKTVSVLNETILIAKDMFTQNTLTGQHTYITSELPDDPNISYEQGIVQ